jgi:hypothetical protein
MQGRGSHIGTAIVETTANAAGHALTAVRPAVLLRCSAVSDDAGAKKRHQARRDLRSSR